MALSIPRLYLLLGCLSLLIVGGLPLAFLFLIHTSDVALHDSYYVALDLGSIVICGSLWATLGGIHFVWPKMTGKAYSKASARAGALTSFAGFTGAFIPQVTMGAQAMPRRYSDFKPDFDLYHQLSTIGAAVLGGGLLIVAWTLLRSLFQSSE